MDLDVPAAPWGVKVFLKGKDVSEKYFSGLFSVLPATVIVSTPSYLPERRVYLKKLLKSLETNLPNTPIMVSETDERSISKWNNRLMELVDTRFAIMCSDDVVLESFDERVLETLDRSTIFGVINKNFDGSRYYDMCWCRWDYNVSCVVPYSTDLSLKDPLGFYYLSGNFLGFSKYIWKLVGGFDESFEHYGSEAEFQERCASVGANLRFFMDFSLKLQYHHPGPMVLS